MERDTNPKGGVMYAYSCNQSVQILRSCPAYCWQGSNKYHLQTPSEVALRYETKNVVAYSQFRL
jgi:hypothetical protein